MLKDLGIMKTLVLNFSTKAYRCYCPEKTVSFHNTLCSLITYKAFWDHSSEKGRCVCVCVCPHPCSQTCHSSHIAGTWRLLRLPPGSQTGIGRLRQVQSQHLALRNNGHIFLKPTGPGCLRNYSPAHCTSITSD